MFKLISEAYQVCKYTMLHHQTKTVMTETKDKIQHSTKGISQAFLLVLPFVR
jgi:hypothetical protein